MSPRLQQRVDWSTKRVGDELQRLVDFPPRHIRHFPLLQAFWDDGSYERSVFVMTKFPDPGGNPKTPELERVIKAVKSAVDASGFTPRVAQFPRNYHPGLWDSVELHLLGCRQGIAIVEDCYLPELNPNVAMEWGWMRGMGKPILFLIEEGFGHFRADLGDLLKEQFSWADPGPSINAAVSGLAEASARQKLGEGEAGELGACDHLRSMASRTSMRGATVSEKLAKSSEFRRGRPSPHTTAPTAPARSRS
jgi:hypothetical protein